MEQPFNSMAQPFDPLDVSIGAYSSEEIRHICQEAIARGERAQREARKRRVRYLVLVLAVAFSGTFTASLLLLL